MPGMETTKIAIFKGKEIRKTIHNDEWWFVIANVVAVLTDSVQPSGYIKDMRKRDKELAKGYTDAWIEKRMRGKPNASPNRRFALLTKDYTCSGGALFGQVKACR